MWRSTFASFDTLLQRPITGVSIEQRCDGVEHSTLSRAILNLERSIGMPIFERSRAGVTTTLADATFLRSAQPMIATAEKMVAMMRAAG